MGPPGRHAEVLRALAGEMDQVQVGPAEQGLQLGLPEASQAHMVHPCLAPLHEATVVGGDTAVEIVGQGAVQDDAVAPAEGLAGNAGPHGSFLEVGHLQS